MRQTNIQFKFSVSYFNYSPQIEIEENCYSNYGFRSIESHDIDSSSSWCARSEGMERSSIVILLICYFNRYGNFPVVQKGYGFSNNRTDQLIWQKKNSLI